MLAPRRTYVLTAETSEERLALLGSWEDAHLAWAEVILRPQAAGGQRMQLALTALPADAPSLADDLFSLYCQVAPDHRPKSDPDRRSLDRALWIGGSASEARDDLWEHQLAALFASRGLNVDVMRRPGDSPLPQALKRVEAFRGVRVFIWVPCTGGEERRDRLVAAAKDPLEIVGERDWEFALTEAAVLLDARDQSLAEEQDGSGGPAVVPTEPLTDGPHYFKKTGSGRGSYGDRMEIRVGPCTHDNFSRSRKPDQAIRGITRVAKAKPVKLEHCDSCTGGGFWRAWF